MKELEQIIDAYAIAESKQQRTALATVVHVEGSSYRAPGARMLITEVGELTGAISGGCLEGDALRKALMVMMEGKPLLTTYDTSNEEDAVIGVGLGCNGIISILIEPVDVNAAVNPIKLLKRVVEQRSPSVLVTLYSIENKRSGQQGTCLFMREDGELLMDVPQAYEDRVLKDAKRVLNDRHASFIAYPADPGKKITMTAFVAYNIPSIALIVAGAGNDIFPLVAIANVLGWRVTLIDGRVSYANEQRFPSCSIMVSEPEEALKNIILDERTAVVLMTHNYQYDKVVLNNLLKNDVRYIGMLGPKKKLQRMLRELADEGLHLTKRDFVRIHSPIGLDIGAETPDEIALAIAAEIQAIFTGSKGGPLHRVSGRIHREGKSIANE